MTTLLYTHPICIEHDPGRGHPECPDRLRAVMQGFEDDDFKALERHEALCYVNPAGCDVPARGIIGSP